MFRGGGAVPGEDETRPVRSRAGNLEVPPSDGERHHRAVAGARRERRVVGAVFEVFHGRASARVAAESGSPAGRTHPRGDDAKRPIVQDDELAVRAADGDVVRPDEGYVFRLFRATVLRLVVRMYKIRLLDRPMSDGDRGRGESHVHDANRPPLVRVPRRDVAVFGAREEPVGPRRVPARRATRRRVPPRDERRALALGRERDPKHVAVRRPRDDHVRPRDAIQGANGAGPRGDPGPARVRQDERVRHRVADVAPRRVEPRDDAVGAAGEQRLVVVPQAQRGDAAAPRDGAVGLDRPGAAPVRLDPPHRAPVAPHEQRAVGHARDDRALAPGVRRRRFQKLTTPDVVDAERAEAHRLARPRPAERVAGRRGPAPELHVLLPPRAKPLDGPRVAIPTNAEHAVTRALLEPRALTRQTDYRFRTLAPASAPRTLGPTRGGPQTSRPDRVVPEPDRRRLRAASSTRRPRRVVVLSRVATRVLAGVLGAPVPDLHGVRVVASDGDEGRAVGGKRHRRHRSHTRVEANALHLHARANVPDGDERARRRARVVVVAERVVHFLGAGARLPGGRERPRRVRRAAKRHLRVAKHVHARDILRVPEEVRLRAGGQVLNDPDRRRVIRDARRFFRLLVPRRRGVLLAARSAHTADEEDVGRFARGAVVPVHVFELEPRVRLKDAPVRVRGDEPRRRADRSAAPRVRDGGPREIGVRARVAPVRPHSRLRRVSRRAAEDAVAEEPHVDRRVFVVVVVVLRATGGSSSPGERVVGGGFDQAAPRAALGLGERFVRVRRVERVAEAEVGPRGAECFPRDAARRRRRRFSGGVVVVGDEGERVREVRLGVFGHRVQAAERRAHRALDLEEARLGDEGGGPGVVVRGDE